MSEIADRGMVMRERRLILLLEQMVNDERLATARGPRRWWFAAKRHYLARKRARLLCEIAKTDEQTTL